MGNTAVAGELIYPSQNDLYGSGVGGIAGDGKKVLEAQWRKAVGHASNHNSYIISGGTLPASDPDLTVQVAAGKAIIDGTYVEWPATSVTLPDNITSWLFLKLVFAGNLISGLEIEDNTSGAIPASSLQLGACTTSGGVMTAGVASGRVEGPGSLVVYTSSGTWVVGAGQYRVRVRVYGASGGGGGGYEPNAVNAGSSGGGGSTTTFGSSLLSASGGLGGIGGDVSGVAGGVGRDGSATGALTIPGGGCGGGNGGGNGGNGGRGGYAEGMFGVTPGNSFAITIGAGGSAGAGGANNGSGPGPAGSAGQAGRIVIEHL